LGEAEAEAERVKVAANPAGPTAYLRDQLGSTLTSPGAMWPKR
jgi:hypothetical protein